jgi:hypothetical protein
MDKRQTIIQFLNRIVGIIVWVALWNIMDVIVDDKDLVVNGSIAVVGLFIWGLLGEYRPQGWTILPIGSQV